LTYLSDGMRMLQRRHCNAGDYQAPQEADWVARDFRFNTGEVMSEVRLHYRTALSKVNCNTCLV
jgi:hypothetical protein